MKKIIFKQRNVLMLKTYDTVICLFLVCLLTACEKPPILSSGNNGVDTTENNKYPIDITFSEYSLNETLCEWTNLSYDDKVIIINSTEELESYILCNDENYSAIDFSEYTLLLAHGIASSSAVTNCNSLQQISEQSYEMEVNILLTQALVLTCWHVPIIVNKLDDGSIIKLVITFKNSEE